VNYPEKILVFEPSHQGHRLTYLRRTLPALAQLGRVVTVLDHDAPDSREYAEQLGRITVPFEVDASLEPVIGLRPTVVARRSLSMLAAAVRRHRPGHVIVTVADGMTAFAAMRSLAGRSIFPHETTSEALFLKGRIGYHDDLTTGERLKNLVTWQCWARSPWSRLLVLDPCAHEAIAERGGSLARRVDLLPDPIDVPPPSSAVEARRRLNLPEDGRYIGCVGLINRRKGCDLLIRAFARADLPASSRLLLMGKVARPVQKLLDEHRELVARGRIIVVDRYTTEQEMFDGYSALDVVAAAYPRHFGSASSVIRAAAARRTVLGSRIGWIGATISRFGLGATCNVNSADGFARAIRTSFDGHTEFKLGRAAERLLAFHTESNFVAVWTRFLRRKLGLTVPASEKSWAWVLEAVEGGR
jgi:glycosyltransferase involved in cell wall biosynthesis